MRHCAVIGPSTKWFHPQCHPWQVKSRSKAIGKVSKLRHNASEAVHNVRDRYHSMDLNSVGSVSLSSSDATRKGKRASSESGQRLSGGGGRKDSDQLAAESHLGGMVEVSEDALEKEEEREEEDGGGDAVASKRHSDGGGGGPRGGASEAPAGVVFETEVPDGSKMALLSSMLEECYLSCDQVL